MLHVSQNSNTEYMKFFRHPHGFERRFERLKLHNKESVKIKAVYILHSFYFFKGIFSLWSEVFISMIAGCTLYLNHYIGWCGSRCEI